MTVGRRFARAVTGAVVARPGLWRLFRRPFRRQFDRLAPVWDVGSRDPAGLLEAALASIETPPARVLDLGTGTGRAALTIARRWPSAEVVGVDLAPAMLEHARRKLDADLAARVTFVEADASALPFDDAAFELVMLANMIPFFDELARVLTPGGHVVFTFSSGSGTPIYVPSARLRRELSQRGFSQFADFGVGSGTALLARKSAYK